MYLDNDKQQDRLDSKRVFLVVESVETMRRVTVDQLRQMGAERVLIAKDGGDALRILNSQTVHVVLADLDMPIMSGIELLRAVRAHERLHALPFLMTTATPDRARVHEAIACGVTGVLLKPYSSNQLVSRLRNALVWKPRKVAPPADETLAKVDSLESALEADISLAQTTPDEGDKPTILLVDDTPENLLLLSQLLKDEYRITLARDGAKALEICSSDQAPDLVLLDIMMPDMDGFEVATRMRQHPNAETIPVIFVTAMTSSDARDRGLDLGAVDFITKPIDPNQLKPRVRNFMRYVQLRKDLQADYDRMVEVAQLREDVERISHHDIKAPLDALSGLLQGLLTRNNLAEADRQQLDQAQALTRQALKLVDL